MALYLVIPCFICGFVKLNNVKIQATTILFIVAQFYKINSTQYTTNIGLITENSLNSVPCTIEIK